MPFAIFGIFSVLIVCSILFLLVVYLKEYAREEKLIEQLTKAQLKLEKDFASMPIYILPPEKKKTSQTEPTTKSVKPKKDVN